MTEEQEAYQERIESIKKALKEKGGVIQPWMYNTMHESKLMEIWKSGEWIL